MGALYMFWIIDDVYSADEIKMYEHSMNKRFASMPSPQRAKKVHLDSAVTGQRMLHKSSRDGVRSDFSNLLLSGWVR